MARQGRGYRPLHPHRAEVIDFKKFERATTCWSMATKIPAYGRITSQHRASGRIISHRVAHFARYSADKVISFRAINDTLDAAEQFIGHQIDLSIVPSDSDLLTV